MFILLLAVVLLQFVLVGILLLLQHHGYYNNNSTTSASTGIAPILQRVPATILSRKRKPPPAWQIGWPVACRKPVPAALANIQVVATTAAASSSSSFEANHNAPTPKILCFIMTTFENHDTRLGGVHSTWGRRCDKLVIISNQTDARFPDTVVTLDRGGQGRHGSQSSSYRNLWLKLNETMHYLYENYGQEYHWFLKADDDTYIIMENLKAFLMLEHQQQQQQQQQPLIYGRKYSWVTFGDLKLRKNFFLQPPHNRNSAPNPNAEFGRRFYTKFINKSAPVVYPHGGAGYVMNMAYVKAFMQAMSSPDTFVGMPPEDLAHGAVMAYHNIGIQNSADDLNRERFHPEPPNFMYSTSLDALEKLVGALLDTEHAVQNGTECCATHSISFHHVATRTMLYYDLMWYTCPALKAKAAAAAAAAIIIGSGAQQAEA
jgi:glycoprotein-N-acetylgalactosamine 3-beta-galactosyltransferase